MGSMENKTTADRLIVEVEGVHCYVSKDGTAYIDAGDAARGLGFVQVKNGVEYIRWETFNRHLAEITFPNNLGNFPNELGIPNKLGKGDYIPEQIFYLLAMKAKNEAAQNFQRKVAFKIMPSIRKYGYYSLVPETAPAPVVTKAAKNPKRVIGQTKPACCYIALMVNETKTFAVVKVGQSYEVEVRLSKIAQKYKLRVDKHYKTLLLPRKISLAVERACKELLAPFKVEGEFFAVDYDTAYKIITTVEGLIADLSKRDTFEDDNALESAESLRLESSNLIADKNLSTDFVGDIFLPE